VNWLQNVTATTYHIAEIYVKLCFRIHFCNELCFLFIHALMQPTFCFVFCTLLYQVVKDNNNNNNRLVTRHMSHNASYANRRRGMSRNHGGLTVQTDEFLQRA